MAVLVSTRGGYVNLILIVEFIQIEDPQLEEDIPDSDTSDDGERVEDVSMVPMADMLNARVGCNNVWITFIALDDLTDQ
jgi:hypothetical protein